MPKSKNVFIITLKICIVYLPSMQQKEIKQKKNSLKILKQNKLLAEHCIPILKPKKSSQNITVAKKHNVSPKTKESLGRPTTTLYFDEMNII